eukprot:COSAG02_NODE_1633_length_11567_cov_16.719567_4_plen_52_part_00
MACLSSMYQYRYGYPGTSMYISILYYTRAAFGFVDFVWRFTFSIGLQFFNC